MSAKKIVTILFCLFLSMALSGSFSYGSENGSISFSAALDNPFLVWSTDGDAPWFAQTYYSYAGGSALQSGHVHGTQTSWVETSVTGPAQISFYWKVISEPGHDFLTFYVDGGPVYSISGEIDWQQRAYALPEGKHTLRWDYKKDNSVDYGLDGGWLDKVEVFGGSYCTYSLAAATANVGVSGGAGTQYVSVDEGCNWVAASNAPWITIISGNRGSGSGVVGYSVAANTGVTRTGTVVIGKQTFTITQESAVGIAVDNTSLLWTTGGDAGWFKAQDYSYAGGSSARSGVLGGYGNKTSWLETVVSGPSAVSFYWMSNSYTLSFYVDNVLVDSVRDNLNFNSGKAEWQRKILSLPAGDHTLKWQFQSDYWSQASDSGWLDKVTVVPAHPDCTYALIPIRTDIPASGGNYTVTVQDGSTCGWLAWSDASWLKIASETSGRGNGAVSYSVEANTGPPRTGTLTIGTETFMVTQASISIGEAVGNTSLPWTTGGDASWFGQSSPAYYSGGTAQSGNVGAGQTSWLETTVAGPVQISFSWRANTSERLRFYVDGVLVRSYAPSAAFTSDWTQVAYPLPEGNHTLRWEVKEGIGWLAKIEVFGGSNCIYSLTPGNANFEPHWAMGVVAMDAGDGCGWVATSDVPWIRITSDGRGTGSGTVDYSIEANASASSRTGNLIIGTQTFTVTQSFLTIGEALDNTTLSWTTGGDAPWFGEPDYLVNGWAQSGHIEVGQTSWLETTVAGPAQIVFNWMATYGDLNFYSDGQLIDSTNTRSWPDGWQQTVYTLPAGTHTLKWEFEQKDTGYYGGSANGAIDKVEILGGPNCTYLLSADSVDLGPYGDGGTVNVQTNSACAWAAISDVPWLKVFPWLMAPPRGRGTGNGTINYSVDLNVDHFRTGTLTIGTERMKVTQRSITLGEALDSTSLSWTTGGDADWFVRVHWLDQDFCGYNGAAAISGYIGDNRTSWIETAVDGPAEISFYWKGSACMDFFGVYADGKLINYLNNGDDVWRQKTFPLPSGSHILRWEAKDGAWSCQGWLDNVEVFGGSGCSYSLFPNEVHVGPDGGAGTVRVEASTGCRWTGMSNVPWITANYTGHREQGNGTVSYSVAANASGAPRTGAIVVGSQTVTIVQEKVYVPVGNAVDNAALSWNTGGDANWSVDGNVSYTGGSSARSGPVGHGQKSWVETTIEGPALISFYWKASPGLGFYFYADETIVYSLGENIAWQQQTYLLPSGTHNLRWEYTKGWDNGYGWLDQVEVFHGCIDTVTPTDAIVAANGGTGDVTVNAGSDCAWLAVGNVPWITIDSGVRGQGSGTLGYTVANNTASARSGTLTIGTKTFAVDQAEGGIPVALDNPSLPWTTGGDADWSVDEDSYHVGGSSVQSGKLGKDQSSWLETTVAGPAQVSFFWMVDCLTYPADYLRFYVDNDSVDAISGNMDWQQKTFIIPAGNHSLKWEFQKSSNYASYPYDGGWLDHVEVFGGPHCSDSLSVTDTTANASGGAYAVDVHAGADCGWLAVSKVPWITIATDSRGVGDGTVNYSVAANSTLSSRTGTMIIGTQTFTVVQEGASAVPIDEALDNTSLSWKTGGSRQWYGQNGLDYTGGSSAQSGEVGMGQNSWLETTIAGPAQISFQWKVSSQPGGAALSCYSDNKLIYVIGGEVDWQQKIYSLPAGNHTLRWEYDNGWASHDSGYGWLDKVEVFSNCVTSISLAETTVAAMGGTYTVNVEAGCNWWATSDVPWLTIASGGSGDTGAGTVNYTVATNPSGEPRVGTITIGTETFTVSQAGIFIPLGDAVDNRSLPWTTGGSANWGISTDIYHAGVTAARTGTAIYEHSSWLKTTVTGPTRISFYWKISAGQENSLRFYADGNLLYLIRGETDWQPKSYFLPTGDHILKWEYVKGGGGSYGSDCGWLDKVMLIYGGETLADAIRVLRLMAGLNMSDKNVTLAADANGDGRIGLAEVIYTLQSVAGLR